MATFTSFSCCCVRKRRKPFLRCCRLDCYSDYGVFIRSWCWGQNTLQSGICDFETQRFAISFHDFSAMFLRNFIKSRAAKRGGFKRGCFPIWNCPSFFVLLCPFWDFPDFSGIFPICSGMVLGFSPIRPFSLSRPIKSTYEEQSRKGPRHNLDLSRKKWETPRFGTPLV